MSAVRSTPPTPQPPAVLSARRVAHALASALKAASGLLLILIAWQAFVKLGGVETIVLPAPLDVFRYVLEHPGRYLEPTLSTLLVASVGLVVGMALGLLLAMLVWTSPFFEGLVTPPALVVRSVPIVAMIPVITRVVGYNQRSVIAVAVMLSFFPTFVLANSGLRAVSISTSDFFAVVGARRRTYFWRLALPSAMPNLLTAVRISAATCIAGALIAEFLMARKGLGALFVQSTVDFNVLQAWGVAFVALAVALLAFAASSKLERWGVKRFK
jgi:NitT/TauT family transport system permease protein